MKEARYWTPRLANFELFSCRNHKHLFRKIENESILWRCDGLNIYGTCKSGMNSFGFYRSQPKYKCTACQNFNLCNKCLIEKEIG